MLFILSILCGSHHWALLSAGLPQMALNTTIIIILEIGRDITKDVIITELSLESYYKDIC